MATKSKNPVWAFFASVKLALFLLIILASTSIIGTVIQQNQPAGKYVQEYGKNTADLIQLLSIDDMYNSWWFLTLLGIFCLNLIICSLERIPNVIRIIRKDNLAENLERLPKMRLHKSIRVDGSLAAAQKKVADYLAGHGWKIDKRDRENGLLLFSQKGAWTRFGVYIVHVSILVILLGAVIGSSTFAQKVLHKPAFAFKGSIMIPETEQRDHIFSFADGSPIPLDFSVRCDNFYIEYYSNGMPKTYLSRVSILEDGKPVPLKNGKTVHNLEVNNPLTYKGITFYQSSYNELPDPVVKIKNKTTGVQHIFTLNPNKLDTDFKWEDGDQRGMFRILEVRNIQTDRGTYTKLHIWLMDSKGPPSSFTMKYHNKVIVERPDTSYEFQVGPRFATGLQVTKDPGVWWVYTGCGMMLFGLFVAFFMSHRKIWAYVSEEEGQTTVIFAGSANKNKVGFEKIFTALVEGFQGSEKP